MTIHAYADRPTPLYGDAYQQKQVAKYRARATNHWKTRIELALRLVEDHALPRLAGRTPGDIRLLDVGCSIGTFAIEFARRGYQAIGIDRDESALRIAARLAKEEGVSPRLLCADLAEWSGGAEGGVDIAVAFDIFEHLHDDELGSMLVAIRRKLSAGGSLVFHTCPTEFDYLFFENDGALSRPLEDAAALPPDQFERRARALALRLDVERVLSGQPTYRESIRLQRHCNPTTPTRLRFILERAGFHPLHLATEQLYGHSQAARFRHQPITHRNLFGVAIPMA